MTIEEAIEVLAQDLPCETDEDLSEAMTMAIKALDQQPCEDAVSRQAVKQVITESIADLEYESENREMQDIIDKLPSVTPKEKTGHWEYVQYDGNPNIGNLHCSECERIAGFEYNYCPNCGARMVSE